MTLLARQCGGARSFLPGRCISMRNSALTSGSPATWRRPMRAAPARESGDRIPGHAPGTPHRGRCCAVLALAGAAWMLSTSRRRPGQDHRHRHQGEAVQMGRQHPAHGGGLARHRRHAGTGGGHRHREVRQRRRGGDGGARHPGTDARHGLPAGAGHPRGGCAAERDRLHRGHPGREGRGLRHPLRREHRRGRQVPRAGARRPRRGESQGHTEARSNSVRARAWTRGCAKASSIRRRTSRSRTAGSRTRSSMPAMAGRSSPPPTDAARTPTSRATGRAKSFGRDPFFRVKHSSHASGAEPQGLCGLRREPLHGRTLEDAELVLSIEPSDLGFATLVPDSTFAVYGLTDESQDAWEENGLTWNEAPAHDPCRRHVTCRTEQSGAARTLRDRAGREPRHPRRCAGPHCWISSSRTPTAS